MAEPTGDQQDISEEDIFREEQEAISEEEIFALEAQAEAQQPETVTGAAPEPPPQREPTAMERFKEWVNGARPAVAGALNYATAGWVDEMAGLVGQNADMAYRMRNGFDPPRDDAQLYRDLRDGYRQTEDTLREDNPAAFHGAGVVAGLLTPTPKMGGGVAGAGRSGALMGAASGLGNSEAELSDPTLADVGRAAFDTGTGAVVGKYLGQGMHVAGEKLGGLTGPAAERFRKYLTEKFAPTQAMRGMGGTGADFTYLSNKEGDGKILAFGRRLLDEDVVPFFSGKQATFEKVQPALRRAGSDMGADLRATDATGELFDMEAFLQRAEQEVIKPNAKSPAIAGEIDALRRLIAKFRSDYPEGVTDFVNANRLKSDLENVENWGNYWNNVGPSQFLDKFAKQVGGIFNDEIEGQMERAAGRATRETFEDAKGRYAAMKWAERITGRAIGKEIGNGPVSLKDMQAGQMAASVVGDNPSLGGLAAAGSVAAYNFARKHGGGALAIGADKLGQSQALYNLARSNPQAFGEFGQRMAEAANKGPEALAIQDWLLAQTSEAYQEWRRGAFGAEPQQ